MELRGVPIILNKPERDESILKNFSWFCLKKICFKTALVSADGCSALLCYLLPWNWMFRSSHNAGAGVLLCFVLLSSTRFQDFGTEKDTCVFQKKQAGLMDICLRWEDLCLKTFYEWKMPGPTWSGKNFFLKPQYFPWLNSFHLWIKIKLTTTKKPKRSSPQAGSFITYTKSVWTFKSLCQTYPIFPVCTLRNFMQFTWVIIIN